MTEVDNEGERSRMGANKSAARRDWNWTDGLAGAKGEVRVYICGEKKQG